MIKLTPLWPWGRGKTKEYKNIKAASQAKRRAPSVKHEATIGGNEFTIIGNQIFTKPMIEELIQNWEKYKY